MVMAESVVENPWNTLSDKAGLEERIGMKLLCQEKGHEENIGARIWTLAFQKQRHRMLEWLI